MIQSKDSNKIGFEISTKTLVLIAGGLAIIALGLLSFSALGASTLMFH